MTTSSPSSSSSRAARTLAAALALALGPGCARAPARPAAPAAGQAPLVRVALFPLENLSGAAAPVRELLAPVEQALAARGLEVVSGDLVQKFLAKYRIRHTGALEPKAAQAAREELGVDGVIITTLELYRAGVPPAFAITMRLVSAGEEPVIRWIDGFARTGDDAPGLLALGLVNDLRVLEAEGLSRLAASLEAFLEGAGRAAPPCTAARRFRPSVAYRSSALEPGRKYTVAVVPFVNHSKRRGAGEVLALAMVRRLAATPGLRPLEPGVVREVLLRGRIVMEGGVSLETVRLLLGTLGADLVLAGEVLDYDDAATPKVNFSVTVLDRGSGEALWQSISHNQGDDGVFFFDAGRVSTAQELTCRMAAAVGDGMTGDLPATPSVFGRR